MNTRDAGNGSLRAAINDANGGLKLFEGLHYTVQIHPRWTQGGSARRFAQSGSDTAAYGAGGRWYAAAPW